MKSLRWRMESTASMVVHEATYGYHQLWPHPVFFAMWWRDVRMHSEIYEAALGTLVDANARRNYRGDSCSRRYTEWKDVQVREPV